MSMDSEEGSQIVASLARQIGDIADIAQIADAIIASLKNMDSALTPIIGQQGVAALFRRSLHLCNSAHPRLASAYQSVQIGTDLTELKSVIVQQGSVEALFFGAVLLTTFYELLTTLIGPSLSARLLRDVWDNSLSAPPAQETSP
jgi:hypothetical protein